ncbi:MAG: hypothetical protein AAF657_03190 [Acidobacteriota bacterium]
MNRKNDRQLLQLLMQRRQRAEMSIDEADRIEQRLRADDELQSSYEQLAGTWDGLQLPEPAATPPGFAQHVLQAARKIRDHELSWALAPTWARLGAAAALVAGLTVGVTFGGAITDSSPFEPEGIYADVDAVPLSLAEAYWLALEGDETLFAEESDSVEGRLQ